MDVYTKCIQYTSVRWMYTLNVYNTQAFDSSMDVYKKCILYTSFWSNGLYTINVNNIQVVYNTCIQYSMDVYNKYIQYMDCIQ